MERHQTSIIGLTAILLAIMALMIIPYLGYLAAGILLAFILQPLQKNLEKKFPPTIVAFNLVVLTIFLALLPLAILGGILTVEATNIIEDIREEDSPINQVEQQLEEILGQQIDLREGIQPLFDIIISMLTGGITQTFTLLSSIVLGYVLLLFTEFYGLRDGEKFVEWTKEIQWMSREVQEKIYQKAAEVAKAVIKGHIGVALIQGILLSLGFIAIGIPNTIFWGFLMTILGVIPLIGGAIIWLPAVTYLIFTNQLINAAILLTWSILVSTFTDDIFRPYLIDNQAIHPYLVITGLVGGISLFGAMGIFIGPITLGVIRILLETYTPYK